MIGFHNLCDGLAISAESLENGTWISKGKWMPWHPWRGGDAECVGATPFGVPPARGPDRAPTFNFRPAEVGAGIAMAGEFSSAHATHLHTLTKIILIPQDTSTYLVGEKLEVSSFFSFFRDSS